MSKQFKATCPKCGCHTVYGWYDEHGLKYHVECTECGHHHEVWNIKYIEAFPDWFTFVEEIDKEEEQMEDDYKEVYFHEYCKTCKHLDLDEKFDPCNECLDEPMNLQSSKPVKWEPKEV